MVETRTMCLSIDTIIYIYIYIYYGYVVYSVYGKMGNVFKTLALTH